MNARHRFMKTRNYGALILALASGLLLSACSDSDNPVEGLLSGEQEPVIWRFALEEIGGSVQDAWAQEFRRRIDALSDGQVQVEVYPYGSIGTSPQLTQLVKDGRVHLAFASPAMWPTTFLRPVFSSCPSCFRRMTGPTAGFWPTTNCRLCCRRDGKTPACSYWTWYRRAG